MPRHYVGSILEVNGTFEYHTKFILVVADNEDFEQACLNVAMNWRGSDKDDWDEPCNGFWNDGTIIKPFSMDYEIDNEELPTASKYLNILDSGE